MKENQRRKYGHKGPTKTKSVILKIEDSRSTCLDVFSAIWAISPLRHLLLLYDASRTAQSLALCSEHFCTIVKTENQ